jgi:tetratricopeptide (TPR) repeat protein
VAILDLGISDVGLSARVEFGAATAFRLCGDRDAALDLCNRAVENANRVQDYGLCSSIWRERGTVLLSGGNLSEASENFDRASQLARDHGLRRLEGISYGSHAEVFFWKGDIEGARRQYDASVALLHGVGERRFFAGAVANRAVIDYELGELESAMAGYKVALTFLRRIGYRRGESDLLANMALVDHAEGRHAQAIRGQEAALRIDREGGNRPGEALRLGNLGIFLAHLGRNTEAELKLNQSLVLSENALSPLVGVVRVYLGLLAARRGDFTTAESELKAGETILEQTSQTELGKAACVRGEVAILAGNLEAADSARETAHGIATTLAASPRSELNRQLLALEVAIGTAKDELEN